jgi:hypothetical protein
MDDSNPALGSAPRSGGATGFRPAAEGQCLRCSFCGLAEGQVARLFEGRAGYICNECVEVCVQLLADYRELGCRPPVIKVPWYRRLFGGEGAKAGQCSFCGAAQSDGEWLLASAQTQICEKCITECLKACEATEADWAFGQ